MQKGVADILADGKVTMNEFMSFAKNYGVNISLGDLPKYIEQAKQLGDMLNGVHPFDVTKMQPFAMSYLSGFTAEKRDLGKDDVREKIDERMHQYAEQLLKDTITGYDNVSVDTFNEKTDLEAWSYGLLPVWITTYNFKDEILPFAINGQTGKTYGRLPLNPGKLAIFSAIIAAAAFGLSLLGGMLFL